MELLFIFAAGVALEGSDGDFLAITNRRIRWRPDTVDPRTDTANDAPFTITIIDDDILEDTEYLEVHFTVETTGFAFPDAIARVTILDNDGGKEGGGKSLYLSIHSIFFLPGSAPGCSLQPLQYTVSEGVEDFVDIIVQTTDATGTGSACVISTMDVTATGGIDTASVLQYYYS